MARLDELKIISKQEENEYFLLKAGHLHNSKDHDDRNVDEHDGDHA